MNRQRLTAIAAIAIGSLLATDTFAVPYASGIRNTTGTTYEFILNEASSNVMIDRNVGGALSLGALAAGRHTFDLGAAATYDLKVSGSSPAGYNTIDDSANLFTSFDRPGGLAINTSPTSPYFGTVYVNQNRGDAVGGSPRTGFGGRIVENGIYALTADRVGVDLPTFTVPADPNDITLAKTAGTDFDVASSSSFYRLNMDDGGNLIASDWSDTKGGIKYLTADLTSGGNLLREASGPTGGVESDDSDEFGPLPLHGSINGEVQVSGTLGVDLVVSAMDEDLDVDLAVASADDGNSVWQWNVGSTIGDYAGAPSLVADVGTLTTSTGAATGQDSSGASVFLNLNIGVTANAQYNAQHDKWYLSGSRSNGDDSSSLVILTPEGAGGDGKDIVVDWASHQFTIDNGLDGFTDDAAEPLSLDANNDIFRQAHNVSFSPDGTIMYLQRRLVHDTNPVLGVGSGLGAKVLAIPLDANGIPDIQFDDNGTPGDPSDDTSNITPIFTQVSDASGSYSQVKVDAAGNVYYTGNQSEALEYFSLGGDTLATTSGGTGGTTAFSVVDAVGGPHAGDANGDGTVDLLDLDILGTNFGASSATFAQGDFNGDTVVDLLDLDILGTHFGHTSADPATAVPEPASLLLLTAGLMGLAGRRARS